MRIRIAWDQGEAYAQLDDTPTARQLQAVLPCRARAQTWGEEVYFDVPVDAALEDDARQVVDAGAVCLWVEGSALALPFGPTPISQGDECRLVAPVNVLGALEGDPRVLASVRAGVEIVVEAA